MVSASVKIFVGGVIERIEEVYAFSNDDLYLKLLEIKKEYQKRKYFRPLTVCKRSVDENGKHPIELSLKSPDISDKELSLIESKVNNK